MCGGVQDMNITIVGASNMGLAIAAYITKIKKHKVIIFSKKIFYQ